MNGRVVPDKEAAEIRRRSLPANQGSPRFETVQSSSRAQDRQSRVPMHGLLPKGWVPAKRRREGWYPVRVFVTGPRNRLS
jgi:hypothetical protein